MTWGWILIGLLLIAATISFLGVFRTAGRVPKTVEQAKVLLRREQVRVRKQRKRLGDVRVRKEVVETIKTMTVPVAREDLVIEKDGVEAARIPLSEDRIDLVTRSVPVNAVSVYKREWHENQQVHAVVRKEVPRIATTGTATYSEDTAMENSNQPPG